MKTVLTSGLRSSVLNAIGCIQLAGGCNTLFGWDNQSVRILKFLFDEEVLTEEDVRAQLDLKLKEIGRMSFEQHKRGEHPDHTTSPEAFAYALQHREFSRKEEKSIGFDHGETIPSFIDEYNENDLLRQKVFCRLLTERQEPLRPEKSSREFVGCCAEHGTCFCCHD